MEATTKGGGEREKDDDVHCAEEYTVYPMSTRRNSNGVILFFLHIMEVD